MRISDWSSDVCSSDLFALDQQVTVQKAFDGPRVIKERLGSIDSKTLAEADLMPVFIEKPAVHRYPAVMAKRVHDLAVHIDAEYELGRASCRERVCKYV